MYSLIDILLYIFFLFALIYGIAIGGGGDDFMGFDSIAFWIVLGIVGFLAYPVLLESLLNAAAYVQRCMGKHDRPLKVDLNGRLPIVYHPRYNITACGLEKVHPFDSQKYGRVVRYLLEQGVVRSEAEFLTPEICPRYLLLEVHSMLYLLSLCYAICISKVVEVPVCFVPAPLLRFRVLTPMLYGTYGSLLAGCAALEKGWAINLSGGYHHSSGANGGGGFCVYADITMLVRLLRRWHPHRVRRVGIVDLDAHQGNGHERDFIGDQDTYIVDFFNPGIYPGDAFAKEGIRHTQHITYNTSDSEYCQLLDRTMDTLLATHQPDLIVYNAGTDCMQGDPLGSLNLSKQGILQRDELVFRKCLEQKVPVVMVLSGGYQQTNAPAIADSIQNLITKLNLI